MRLETGGKGGEERPCRLQLRCYFRYRKPGELSL